tara:strand:+ start:290 stop:496 length:207 start_codon:yes stop_codon:yes gene_type:complete
MIEFIDMCEIPAEAEKGQLTLFANYIVEPGDIGLIVSEDKASISFLIGNVCLSVEKHKEGVKYVRTPK